MPANGKNGRIADENPARRMAGICLPALVQMCESGRVKNDGRGISRMSSVNRRIGERCRVGAVVAFAGVMSGCLSPHRTVVADVDPTGWAEPVTVRFANTDTLSANGINTKNRPAKESSAVSRGPLVEMGSLVICTRISCPTLSRSLMAPSFSSSFCNLYLGRESVCLRSESDCLVNFALVVKNGPKSW